jgi:hypothetical protein
METSTFANRHLRLAALLYILRRKRHRSIQRKKLIVLYKCITKHQYSSDLWPLKMKRNCIVDKSLAVRNVDHKSLALRLSTGLSLYL